VTWTQAVCENGWRDYSQREFGYVRTPSRVQVPFEEEEQREEERCCFCGNVTDSGIFIRIDPKTVPYPRSE